MIHKPLNEITNADLAALIDGGVHESKTIEYKLTLPGMSDGDKREFLKDVSAFANTEGGDLLYGVEAPDGLPIAIPGLGVVDEDAVKQRLVNLLRDGVQPRIPGIDMRFVVAGLGPVLLVRVPRSWSVPHRVILGGYGHFYGRTSTSADPLDVGQLRDAFTRSMSIEEKIEAFRSERIAALYTGKAPIKIRQGCKLVMHLIPFSAFAGGGRFEIARLQGQFSNLRPFGANGDGESRISLDGFLHYMHVGDSGSRAYTLAFRSGAVEAVGLFYPKLDGRKFIESHYVVQYLHNALRTYLQALDALEIESQVILFVSLIGAEGYTFMVVPPGYDINYAQGAVADSSNYVLPGVVVQSYQEPVANTLKPALDMIWNSFGYERCTSYDEAGNFIGF